MAEELKVVRGFLLSVIHCNSWRINTSCELLVEQNCQQRNMCLQYEHDQKQRQHGPFWLRAVQYFGLRLSETRFSTWPGGEANILSSMNSQEEVPRVGRFLDHSQYPSFPIQDALLRNVQLIKAIRHFVQTPLSRCGHHAFSLAHYHCELHGEVGP